MNSIIVSTIMLFIIGFFVGKAEENKKKNEQEQQAIENKEDGLSYSDIYGDPQEDQENEEDHEDDPLHDHYNYENPELFLDENAEREVNILEDFFTKEEIIEAKKVSEEFIKNYYPFDGDNPIKHIENSFKFCTDDLKEKLSRGNIKPVADYYSRNYIEISVFEPYDPAENEMIINVRVTGEVFNAEGKKVDNELVEYELNLIPYENTFKIKDYSYKSMT